MKQEKTVNPNSPKAKIEALQKQVAHLTSVVSEQAEMIVAIQKQLQKK